jgi:hypothetical protein
MDDTLESELHILNFFRVKNDYATIIEMNDDLKRSGLHIPGKEFQKVLDAEYLDMERLNGRFTYKINEHGLARLVRLTKQYETKKPASIFYNIGRNVTSSVIGSQVSVMHVQLKEEPPQQQPKKNKKVKAILVAGKFLWENIWKVLISVIGGVITAYILLRLGIKK